MSNKEINNVNLMKLVIKTKKCYRLIICANKQKRESKMCFCSTCARKITDVLKCLERTIQQLYSVKMGYLSNTSRGVFIRRCCLDMRPYNLHTYILYAKRAYKQKLML